MGTRIASSRADRRAISTRRLLTISTAVLISKTFIGSETGIQSLRKLPVKGSNLPAPRRATNKVVNEMNSITIDAIVNINPNR
jgi:hypothetical protein